MTRYQNQKNQTIRGPSHPKVGESGNRHDESVERELAEQHFRGAGIPFSDSDISLSGGPISSIAGPYYDLDCDDIVSRTPNVGQFQTNFCDAESREAYQDETHYLRSHTSKSRPLDFSPELQIYPDLDKLSDSDLFWVQYQHGANVGRDLFPRWKGLQTDDLPPRETLRLIPNEERNLTHMSGKLQIAKNENGEQIRSELTDEHLYELPFLPRYIDMKTDAATKNIDNWIIMGADLRRDIIPRSINYNPYHSFDENGDEFFDWKATAAHLQRTYTNKHMKRAEQPHVMGGLLRKFRMDKGRFAEFLTPITFDKQGNQRRMLLNMENLLFNTRWDIDLDRMVMRNPHSHQELPLFTPVEVRPQVRECLEKMLPHERVPTLRDLFQKYPHVSGYDERNHPLFRRSEELDTQLRRSWEMEAARRGNRRPPITVTKPNYVKGRKEITAKRKKRKNDAPPDDDEEKEEDERPSKRTKTTTKSDKSPPQRNISAVAAPRTKRPLKLSKSPLAHHSQYSVGQSSHASTYSTYQETPITASFHEASHTQMDLLLQPMPDLNLVPEELLYHPPVDCFDENGVFIQILISQYYAALTPENRQMYRNIRDAQGLNTAKQRLLETFGLQQTSITPRMATGHGPGMMPDEFAPMTGGNDSRAMAVQFDDGTALSIPQFSPSPILPHGVRAPETRNYDTHRNAEALPVDQPSQYYDPQLLNMHADAAIDQRQDSLFPPNARHHLLSPWSPEITFDNGVPLGHIEENGEAIDQAVNLPSWNDSLTDGLYFTTNTGELSDGDWAQHDDMNEYHDDAIIQG
ncbi:hypothetical protein FKW77_009633 [Venturia effusa]|uniref:Uncharacterized protein n=1 Tax=Venturia effusa TaxID=50376 RepID=A0A517L438_9PEZI|nr:hypothetical protein FKW77_009633 [Venturia effusa]